MSTTCLPRLQHLVLTQWRHRCRFRHRQLLPYGQHLPIHLSWDVDTGFVVLHVISSSLYVEYQELCVNLLMVSGSLTSRMMTLRTNDDRHEWPSLSDSDSVCLISRVSSTKVVVCVSLMYPGELQIDSISSPIVFHGAGLYQPHACPKRDPLHDATGSNRSLAVSVIICTLLFIRSIVFHTLYAYTPLLFP